jgi:hypothetical protein
MSAQIIPFPNATPPVETAREMTHEESEWHYARRINTIIKAMRDAGFGANLDRIATTWQEVCAAHGAEQGKISPHRAGKPLIFAVPNLDRARKQRRPKPKPASMT